MYRQSIHFLPIAFFTFLGFTSAQEFETSETQAEVLQRILQEQAEAWNRGSIEEFMDAYWKSEDLTFSSGGETRRGWQTTLERYRARYPDRATMGILAFTELETRTLGQKAALILGRWKLKREAPLEDLAGNFSLVWQRIEGKWVIIHDHTSSDP